MSSLHALLLCFFLGLVFKAMQRLFCLIMPGLIGLKLANTKSQIQTGLCLCHPQHCEPLWIPISEKAIGNAGMLIYATEMIEAGKVLNLYW